MIMSSEKILLYEMGMMSLAEAVPMFKSLWESGEIWNLPDSYLSVAGVMMEQGLFDNVSRGH